MKTKLYILILFLAINQISIAQIDSVLKISLVKTLAGDIADFTTDNLGNVYIINSFNQLKKFNDKGDSVSSINDIKRYGPISSVDATNPLKILVFYKEFSRLIVLDRLLNVRNTIDLRQQNIFQIQAFTSSYDNNIWLYDEVESKLKKVDDYGKLLLQTNDFRQIFAAAPTPITISDNDGFVYLYDPAKGLLVFDYYGALRNNIQLKNIKDIQVIDKNTITGRDSSRIILYKPASLQLYYFKIATGNIAFKKIRFSGTKFYGLTKEGELKIYTVL